MLFSQWGKVTKENIRVEPNGVSSAAMMISMVAGELQLSSGTDMLLSGEVRYSDNDWKPVLWTKKKDNRMDISLKMPPQGPSLSMGDEDVNTWELRMNRTLPTDLLLTLGAGKSNINLEGVNLTSLYLKLGAGEFHVNVSGSSVPKLQIHAGVGQVFLNLGGEWKNDLIAQINGGIGELTIYVPEQVGVFVQVSGVLGEIDAPGFHREGHTYMNEAFAKPGPVLKIQINAGIGQINLRSK
jgi:hypothetical protein